MRIPFSASFNSRSKSGMTQHVKKSTSLGLIVILILTTFLPILGFITPSLNPVQASSDWWNEDWTYRQSINLNSLTTQSNVYYQFQLDTSNATKFNTDCSDLRFISNTGQQIPHHLVSGCGTSNTQIQLLFSNIPQGDQDIYVYYGNTQAITTNTADPFNNLATGITSQMNGEELSSGPLVYWKLDESYGTTAHDSTTNKHSTNLYGPEWRSKDQCVSGTCLDYDRDQSDYTYTPTASNINDKISTKLTISAWAYWRGNGIGNDGQQMIVTGGDLRFGIHTPTTTGRIGVYCDTCSTPAWYDSEIMPQNTWQHLVVTMDGNAVTIYINGRAATVASYAGSVNGTSGWVIGSLGNNTYNWNGAIDEIKVYDYARSQQQIQQDYVRGIQSLQAQQGNLSNGLVGHWKMDEASWNGTTGEVKDSSGNNNNGHAMNGAAASSGKYGNGGNFDGVDDYINTDSTIGCSLNQSVSAWVFPASIINGNTVFEVRSCGGRFLVYWNSNKFSFYAHDAGNFNSGNFMANQWYHLVVTTQVTKEGQNLARIYVNGSLSAESNRTFSSPGNPTNMTIGSVGSGTTNYFQGQIDDVRLYNRTLSSTESSQLYTSAPKPVVYYDFEEASGNPVYDKSGNGNNGVWSGASRQNVAGKNGKAGLFNGIDSVVNIPLNPQLTVGLNNFSYCFWLKSNDLSGLVFGHGTWNYASWGAYAQSNGKVRFELKPSSDIGANYVVDTPVVLDGQEHYLCASIDRSTRMSVYSDGILSGSVSVVGGVSSFINGANYNLEIGKGGGPGAFGGAIDEVKFYNYARTQSQVLEDMQAGRSSVNSPFGHWKFDEGQGVVTHDSGLNSYDATLSNAAWANGCQNGNCLSFNGSDSYALSGDFVLDSPLQITTSFWLNPNDNGPNIPTLLSDNDQKGSSGYIWIYRSGSNGSAIVYQYADGTDFRNVNFTNAIIPNQWHQYTFVADYIQATVKLYRDGKYMDTKNMDTPLSPNSTELYFGRYRNDHASSMYSGLMDEVKIYKRALTPQDILIDYNQSSTTVIGSSSTEQTISQSGQTTTQPSNSQHATYCVPGSTDYCAKPIAHYDFEEGAGTVIKDSSGNNNSGVLSGSPRWTPGQAGKGLFLQSGGTSAIISSLTGQLGSTLTVEAWVDYVPTGPGNFNRLVNRGWVGDGWLLGVYNPGTGNRAMFGIAQDGIQYNATISIVPGKVHLVGIYDGSKVSLFINGMLASTISHSGATLNTTSNVILGTSNSTPETIDNIKIYNYARTPAQIAWDYNNGKPVAHYKLDECSGSTIHDSSGNNLHGMLNLGGSDNTAIGTCNTSGAWSLGSQGRYNSSLSFDGVDDVVVAQNTEDALNFTERYSISTWIMRPISIPGGIRSILAKRTTNIVSPYVLQMNNNRVNFQFYTTEGSWNSTMADQSPLCTIKPSTWHHIAAIWDGQVKRLYIDSRLCGQSTPPAGPVSNNQNLSIGRDFAYAGIPGQIDDVQIFNYALTQTQIDTLYNGGAVRWGQ